MAMKSKKLFDKNSIAKPCYKWVRECVPQETVTGGKCMLWKWTREDRLEEIRKKLKELEPEPKPKPRPEPEPEIEDTEIVFLCTYEGCGRTFYEAVEMKNHSRVHMTKHSNALPKIENESSGYSDRETRQFVCSYEGCGKSFKDNSKLKRHNLIHSGVKSFICPHEGCGKAFALDFNMKAHMRTHCEENYHACPYESCSKRYASEEKLNSHIKVHHEKLLKLEGAKHSSQSRRINARSVSAVPDRERPYACHYPGCEKAYIHEYKLNLHFRDNPKHNVEHQRPNREEIRKPMSNDNAYKNKYLAIDQVGDYHSTGKKLKRNKPDLPSKLAPPTKFAKLRDLVSIRSSPSNVVSSQSTSATDSMSGDDDEEAAW